MGGNIFAVARQGWDDTTSKIEGIQKKRADYRAAPLIAQGNFSGAAGEYGQAGLADDARQMVGDQQVIDDRKTRAGNVEEDRQQKEAAHRLETLGKITDALGTVPEGQRKPALVHLMPIFQQLGMDPGPFAGLDETHLTNASLAPWKAALDKAQADYTLTPGATRYDGQNHVVASVPAEQKYVPLPAGGSLVPLPRSGQPAPDPSAPPAAAAPANGVARGNRNNNPLNITGAGWNGQTGSDGRFAVFGSPDEGFAAADKNLQTYATKHGINTLSGVINRWAPAGDGNNDPQAYIATVARDLGVDPNQPLNLADPTVRAGVLRSMAKVESPHRSGSAAPIHPAPASDGLPPGTIRGPAKPAEWTPDGKGNLLNANGDRKVDPTYDGAGAADPNVVKMVLDGRYPPPTGRAATDPKWQAVLQQAAAEDPNFNAADYHTRYATRKDFTSGKAATNITALNTALGHIGELDSQIDGLKNTSIPLLNQAGNMFAAATGDPRVGNFNTTKSAVASELVRVFRQAGGTEADIQDFQKPLDAANSPEQLHGVVKEMTKLLASRLDAMAAQYKQGLGQDKAGVEFLNPKAQAVFNKVMLGRSAPKPSAQRLSPEQAAKLPPGSKFVGTDGVERTRH